MASPCLEAQQPRWERNVNIASEICCILADCCVIVCQTVSQRSRTVCTVPVRLRDRVMFSIGEALSRVGVSRSTYFRWVRLGRIPDTQFKDRNGRRVFTEEEVDLLSHVANELRETDAQARLEFGSPKA